MEALGRKWHKNCFTCTECNCELSSSFMTDEAKRPYCREHFLSRAGNRCGKCGGPIEGESVTYNNQKLHTRCFSCKDCGRSLAGRQYLTFEGQLYCNTHFKCCVCNEGLTSQIMYALGKRYHPHHFNCYNCKKNLLDESFYSRDKQPYCKVCYNM